MRFCEAVATRRGHILTSLYVCKQTTTQPEHLGNRIHRLGFAGLFVHGMFYVFKFIKYDFVLLVYDYYTKINALVMSDISHLTSNCCLRRACMEEGQGDEGWGHAA